MNNKGSLYTEVILGIFGIAAAMIIYIILNQVWTYNIQPDAITDGTDPTNLNYITIAWTMWPIPVVIAFVFSIIRSSLQNRGGGIYAE